MPSNKFSARGGKGRRLPPAPKPVKFNLPVEQYTPYAVLEFVGTFDGERAARKEYTRLRNIAQKRIRRLASDPLLKRLESVRETISVGFPTLAEIGGSRQALAGYLSGLRKFLSAEESTVYGARRRFERNVEKAREAVGDFVSAENYPDFDRFMQYAREVTRGFRVGSPEIADFFDENSGKYTTQDDLEYAFSEWLAMSGRSD